MKLKTGIAAIYAILAIIFVMLLFSNRVYDDPFITYRYAVNLAKGEGFVYNPGEHTLSTTTPLFTLFLACIAWLGTTITQLPLIANLTGAVSLGITGLLLWKLGLIFKSSWVGWTGLMLYPIFPLAVLTIGSETPLYIALCLGAMLLYFQQHYTGTAIIAALAVLTRPDGILIPLLLAGHYLILVRKPIPWRAIMSFILITGSWALFAWYYFGSPLPVTLLAKQQQVNIAASENFASGLFTILGWFNQWPYWLALALALIGSLYLIKRKHSWLMVIVWTILYFTGYSLLGVSRYFWYYAPLVPGFLVLVGSGIAWMASRFQQEANSEQPRKPGLALLPVLLIIFLVAVQAKNLWEMHELPDQRSGLYRQVGQWLAENTPPDVSVSTLETGIIGYYAQRRMVDFAGLLYPDVAESMTVGSTYEDAALYVNQRYNPDILVIQQGLFPHLEAELTMRQCKVLVTFQEAISPYLLDIYSCQ